MGIVGYLSKIVRLTDVKPRNSLLHGTNNNKSNNQLYPKTFLDSQMQFRSEIILLR
jgi:hypothetical protein